MLITIPDVLSAGEVAQARAALDAAGVVVPEAKLAAERGLQKPYEPPVAKQPQ